MLFRPWQSVQGQSVLSFFYTEKTPSPSRGGGSTGEPSLGWRLPEKSYGWCGGQNVAQLLLKTFLRFQADFWCHDRCGNSGEDLRDLEGADRKIDRLVSTHSFSLKPSLRVPHNKRVPRTRSEKRWPHYGYVEEVLSGVDHQGSLETWLQQSLEVLLKLVI